jgi:hypothetical protein
MTLTTQGNQSDISDVTITTARGGSTNQGSGRSASFKWNVTGEADVYGFDYPVSITDFDVVQQELAGVTEVRDPHAISLSSGRLLIACQVNSGLLRQVKVYRKDPGGSYSNVQLINLSSTVLNNDYHPSICELPNGDILVALYVSLGSSTDAQIRIYRSTDSGESFTLANDEALDTPINISTSISDPGVTLKRMIMIANQSTVLILGRGVFNNTADPARERIVQAVSSNQGASFKLINGTGTSGSNFCLIGAYVDSDGAFNAAFILNDSRASLYKLPHAYFSLEKVSSITGNDIYNGAVNIATIASNTFTDGDEAFLWRDSTGKLYAILKNISQADGSYFIRVSEDKGASFRFVQNKVDTVLAADIPAIFRFGASTTTLKELACCEVEGRSVICCTFDSSGGTYDESLVAVYLGGYSTITLPSSDPTGDNPIRKLVALEQTWLPFDLPGVSSLITSGGAGTETLTTKLNVSTSAQIRSYNISPTVDIEKGYIIRMSYTPISGGATSNLFRGIKLRLDNGTTRSYEVEIRISTNKIAVYDTIAGAFVGSEFATGSSHKTEILCAFFDGEIKLFVNKFPVDSPHLFHTAVTSSSLSNGGGGGTASFIKWGHLDIGTAETDFHSFLWSFDEQTGNQLSIESFGREFPVQGTYIYLNGGLEISTQDSPTYQGDTWRIQRTADYPLDNIFFDFNTSPRVQYRSTAVTSGAVPLQFIPLYMDSSIAENQNSPFGNDLIYISLMGINFETWELKYYNAGTSSWVSKAIVDNSRGLTGTFTRQGSVIVPPGGSPQSNPFYLFNNELLDCIAVLDDGAGTVVRREIETNTEGVYDNKSGKRASIKLKNALHTDPTTGTLKVIPKNVTVVISILGVKGAAWGISLTSQETFHNDFRIGSFSMGPVAVFSPQYGRGRSITFEPNTEIFEQPDNTVRVRNRGPGRRVARISWSDGVDLRPFYDSNIDPDYYKSSQSGGAQAVANFGDIPYQLQGVYHYLQGSKPIMYYPSIPVSTLSAGDIRIYNRRTQFLYGLTDGALSFDSVLGDELEDEVFRVATVIIREVV